MKSGIGRRLRSEGKGDEKREVRDIR